MRSAASKTASFMAPTAPFSRKSRAVAENSFFRPSTSHLPFSDTDWGTGTWLARFVKLVPAASASLLKSRSMRSFATDVAPLTTVLAPLPTMSTASMVASLSAPTTPFSLKSWTVALHSSFRPVCALLQRPRAPLVTPPASPSPSGAFGNSTPGASTSTRMGSSTPGMDTRARGGSDTPSTSTTATSTMRPSANSSGNEAPTVGAPSQRSTACIASSSPTRSPATVCTPSQTMPPASAARSRASSTASVMAPTKPFCRKSSTVPMTSLLRALKRNAISKSA
mmetsp:Transcript_33028/g.87292  ORF Transcript_33028/g.87292 Transcript_33028/m.87292 type:complete len:281 (-) Transcript_33028:81-923(-)